MEKQPGGLRILCRNMVNKLKLAWQLWRQMGLRWLLFRVSYAIQVHTGILRLRTPVFAWHERPLRSWLKSDVPGEPEAYRRWREQHGGHFFFDELPAVPANASWHTRSVVEAADEILDGKWPYFRHTIYEVGCPPDWHVNPMTGERIPADRHWTQIGEFDQGDIKLVWEASRFSNVYTLVRAYASTRNEHYPEAFWNLVEDWARNNPPHLGPNWKSGQEVALRLMAWCFGLYAFSGSVHSTAERIAFAAAVIAAQAERIAMDIAYAHSTKSNHGISEAAGLWTVGLLFPEFAQAAQWREAGRCLLEKEIRRQIYADGSYVMPSANYYRMSLQICLWAIRLGEKNQVPLARDVNVLVAKGLKFLYHLLDPDTAQLPNFGSNDGAYALPLDSCSYMDFRPILQLGYYTIDRGHCFEDGPWNEPLLWLFGPEALDTPPAVSAPPHIDDLSAEQGGYFTLRGDHSWIFIHCAHFTDRPSQIDQLHVDLWWRGINIACDPGTYLYNGPSPWHNGLVSTGVHNTVQVDGQEQMTQAGHFTWVNWAQGNVRCQSRSEQGQIAYWEGGHNGYQRLSNPVLHRRGVARLGMEHWLVVDYLQSSGKHTYRLHWLMPELAHTWDPLSGTLLFDTPSGPYLARMGCSSPGVDYSLVIGEQHSTRGWYSCYYGHKQPAISLAAQAKDSTLWFWTLFGPDMTLQFLDDHMMQLTSATWTGNVQLGAGCSPERLIRSISLVGDRHDTLETTVS